MRFPMPPNTLTDLFQRTVHEHGPRVAMRYKHEDHWHAITYAQMGELVKQASLGLHDLGVEKGDRLGILSGNRPEWAISDLATLHAGAALAPIYDTLLPDQVAYILEDAGAEICFVAGGELLERVVTAAKDAPTLKTVVVFDEHALEEAELPKKLPGNLTELISMQALYERGKQVLRDEESATESYERRWKGLDGSDLATLIYTSGTTGNPKGVMLSHANLTSNVHASCEIIELHPGERYLSFLPLSHSFERTAGHYIPYSVGGEVWFAESMETVGENLKECRPQLLLAVPRLYEKMGEGIRGALAAAEGFKATLANWSLDVGKQAFEAELAGRKPSGLLAMKLSLADKLVLGKVRAKIGLENVRYAASGAAALDPEVARLFGALGMPVYEGYGMTELSPVVSVSGPGRYKVGAVGKTIADIEVKIDTEGWDGQPDEGEILVRGPNVMQGYWEKPEATAEALDEDGWMHTGDVGKLDSDGFLYITDRKKELFKTAYGKYIAPAHLDNLLKRNAIVDQALIIGEKRKYVSALISPNQEELEAWAKKNDVTFRDVSELVARDDIQTMFEQAVEDANEELARYEQIKRFDVLDKPFEVGEELTPTMKVKRRVVEDNYAKRIKALYKDA